VDALLAAIPASVTRVAVLDRCKEPGADGEPLYKDVMTAFAEAAADGRRPMPRIIGGRYGLASKEFTPAWSRPCSTNPVGPAPAAVHRGHRRRRDPPVAGLGRRLPHRRLARLQHAVFWGLGADGTVSANKNSIKIVGESTALQAQGYFVHDSKKSGAVTVSHLRFGRGPIRSSYLVEEGMAGFVACHQTVFVERYDLLAHAAPGGSSCSTRRWPPMRCGPACRRPCGRHPVAASSCG
jgi:pyruvate-ferredoxin/flavodoxin oxidoreductase